MMRIVRIFQARLLRHAAKVGKYSLIAGLLATGACTRKFYREQTDKDVHGLMTQKNQSSEWAIENWHIYPDPRARHADPSNPDRPPKPHDDPAAEVLSPNPQKAKKVGTADFEGDGWLKYLELWNQANREEDLTTGNKYALTPREGTGASGYGTAPNAPADADRRGQLANTYEETLRPPQRSDLVTTYERALKSEIPTYRLRMDQATELSLFNSREFQDRREDLYNAALPVSLERFSFTAQFFGTANAIREVTGRETADGKGNRWRLNTAGGFSRLFPTGALLMVQLANRLVVDLGNGRPDLSATTLSLDLVQPLLQGGGFAVNLENLTQAERNLLYAIRSYARFRKIYYLFIATGDDVFNSPFSFAGLNLRGVGPTLTPGSQGYLPTLLLSAQQRNEIDNVAKLEEYLVQFRGFAEGSDVSPLQVDQVEQQLLSSRNALIARRLAVQNALDLFKLQLGVPTSVPLELDGRPVGPITEQLDRFGTLREEFDAVRKQADNYIVASQQHAQLLGGGVLAPIPMEVPLRGYLGDLFVNSAVVKGTEFKKTFPARWEAWTNRTVPEIKEALSSLREQQRNLLNKKATLEREGGALIPLDAVILAGLPREIYLGLFEQNLREYESKQMPKENPARAMREQASLYREVINLFTLVLSEAREERLEQIQEAWPSLPPVNVNGVDILREDLDRCISLASQLALTNRLELMNARGQLVDAWRQIAVQANGLQGVLDVAYHGDFSSPANANRPAAIGGSRSRNQLIINGELPLVRRLERNNYRVSLIAFQRQRRATMATEDFILNDIRSEVRNVRTLAELYKIQQRSVEVAYALVENSLDVFQAPPDPRSVGGGQTAGNAAALTQQLLSAQSSLVRAQNDLYDVWVRFLIARMQLYRDLELLPLDSRGVWNDECTYQSNAEPLGPPSTGAGPRRDPAAAGAGGGPQGGPLPEPQVAPGVAK